jgi:hypothetical protein
MGFRPEKVVVMETDVPSSGLEGARHATQLYKGFLAEASVIPGVSSVAATRSLPHDASSNGGYWIDSLPPIETLSVGAPQAVFSIVTPNYFGTMGIPLESGRDLADGDSYDAPFVAVINEALAKEAFPKQNRLATRFSAGWTHSRACASSGWKCPPIRPRPHRPGPEIFMQYEQHPLPSTSLIVVARTPSNRARRQTLRRSCAIFLLKCRRVCSTMQAELGVRGRSRFRALLIGVFAAGACAFDGGHLRRDGVHCGGAYAKSAFAWRSVRSPAGLHLVLGQGMRLVVAGLVVGSARLSPRLLTSMLSK